MTNIRKIRRRIIRSWSAGFILVICSTILGVILAEGIVYVFDLDWRFIKRLLYFQSGDVANHISDPDPRLLYRLREGVYQYEKYTVTVNAFGHRGPERSAKKPHGVFRILCVGASNVYGAGLNDHETWPAKLEQQLNASSPGRFEVWNMGTSAYVGSQMVIVAKEAIERYDPDLIILALSNSAGRAFLKGEPVKHYFENNPEFWPIIFPPDYLLFPSWLSYEERITLIRHSRLFRMGFLAVKAASGDLKKWINQPIHEDENIDRIQQFLTKTPRNIPVCLFLCPNTACHLQPIDKITAGLNIALLDLDAADMPKEYREIHPPAYVMTWYASKIATWLSEQDLIPGL